MGSHKALGRLRGLVWVRPPAVMPRTFQSRLCAERKKPCQHEDVPPKVLLVTRKQESGWGPVAPGWGGRRAGGGAQLRGLPAPPPLQHGHGPLLCRSPPSPPLVQDVGSRHTGSGVSGLQWMGGQLQVGQGAPRRWAAGRGTVRGGAL